VELAQPRIIVAESAAVGLYIAQKAGKLIPSDFHGRTRETQWCFAAMNSRKIMIQL
jgi:glutathione S-transferase